jgi:predicted dehydrogenase
MAKIKVGVVGTGFIGPAHIEALRRLPNIEVAALCDSRPFAVVWASMAHAVEGQAGVSFFPEWPRHVPSEVSTCFFCRAGPRLAL